MNQPWVIGMNPQPPTTEKRAALMGRHRSCWKRLERVTPTVETPAEQLLENIKIVLLFHFFCCLVHSVLIKL